MPGVARNSTPPAMLYWEAEGGRDIWTCYFPSPLGSTGKSMAEGVCVRALWNKWEGPGSAGRETVYAAKGLDTHS